MKTSMSDRIARHAQNGRRRIRMIALFACLALVVGTCVEMALRQRGITLTASSEVLDCHVTGKVAHKHSAECYDSNKKLICQLPERELHKHDKTCYSDDGKLVCGKEEITNEHVHGPGCMRTISAPAEDGGKPKTFTHTFKDKSGTPVVRVDVVAPADALPEGTTMRATWLEESQVDKKLVQEAVTKRSGGKVLQMQAMDISFFDADGNEVEPASEVTVKLMSTIISEANAPMVVHVEDQAEAQERAEEQAANAGVADAKAQTKPEGEVMRQLSSQEMALRDESLAKNQIAFETSDFSTYVIATTSLRHTMHASDNATVTIDVDAPVEAGLPADAKLKIDEIPRDSAEYKQYEAQALQVTGEKTSALARFFNIKIMSGDKEIQPDADVSVSVKLNDAPKADANAEAQVVHFGTKPEVVASREEDGTTQFQTKSFSVYGVMYTVDFEYQGLTAVLPGEKAMTLSKLLASLGIGESVANVTEVTFTNPNVLKVEKAGPGATIQRLIADIIAEQEAGAAESGSNAANEGAGDVGAADEDITVELSTDQDERLVEVPLAEGEDFEPVPDPVQNVPVAEGDWILTSLQSFETEETLTVKTEKTVYEIRVTDPPVALASPWGPGTGFFGGTANWNLATLAADGSKATLSVSYDATKDYAAGDDIVFDFTYQIERAGWSDYNPWMGYPTFTYDASSILKSPNFKDLKPGKSYLTFGGKKRGTIEVKADGKIIIQVTDTNWFNTRDEIGGAFTVKLKLSEEGAGHADGIEFTFPGTTTPVKIPVKVNITSGGKKVVPGETGGPDDDGNYTITYESKVKIPSGLTKLMLVDTMNGKQTFGGLVSVTGPNGSVNGGTTSPESGGQSFTYTFPNPSELGAGEYTVKYKTVVSDFNSINGSSWENNTCTWEYNDGKELPGGNTTHEVKNSGGGSPGGGGNQGQNQDQPTVSKTSTVNGQPLGNNVAPGTVIDHTLTIEGKKLAGMQYFDNMTDLQDIVGTPTVKVYEKNGESYQEKPSAEADKIKNNMQVNAGDSSYYASGTQAISGTVPDEPPFKDDNKTFKIEITYKTRVISQDTATANGIYGQQNVDNSFSENRTWQQHTTSTKVKYEDQPVTKVTKTAALSETAGDNTLASNGTITYTIVVGDGTTTLDGVKVKDYASGDQQILADTYTIEGSNVNINKADIHPSLPAEPQGWDQTALDFTFPAGTGTGPVTITYQAQPYGDANNNNNINDANEKGIYGLRNFSNKVTTGTDEATTNVKYSYPEKPEFPIAKIPSSTDMSGGETTDKLDPEETIDYTIYFNSDSDKVNNLSIMDEMTDLQKLKVKDGDGYKASVVHVELGSGVFTQNGTTYDANGTFTKNTTTTAYGKVGNTIIRFFNGVLQYKSGEEWKDGMPVASYGWADDGVSWSHFDDGSYSDNTVRVFNFKFPTEFYTTLEQNGNLTDKTDVVGTVRVTYTTTVITKDEAATSKIMGDKDIKNTVTCNETRKETTEPATFPKNLNHNAVVNKQFNGWDDDGYTTWWTIDIKADEDSSYPLQKLTLTEDWASGSINYSTDWPVQNFNKNVLADIDLLGAQITTDSGVTLQPGRDYTIDKEKGSFYFETLDEPITIRIAIHNPDATINTFYQRNKVKLTWKKDQYNNGEATAEATGRRVKQEVDLTKNGTYDEVNSEITWKVIFNPYNKTVVPEWNQIRFEDTMAEGLELTGTVDVHNSSSYQTENISTANMTAITEQLNATTYNKFVTQTDKDKGIKDVKVSDSGSGKVALITYNDGTSKFVVADIDPHSQWGNPITGNNKYYCGNKEEGYTEFDNRDEYDAYVAQYNTANARQEAERTDYEKRIVRNPPIAEEGIGLGLSGKTYTVTYKTKVTGDKWNKITSSLTGKEVFQNHVTMKNDAADAKFEAQNKVNVEGKDYLRKHDVTQEDSDGYIIDEEEIHDNAVSYEVEVNPNKYVVNSGKSLTLTDRIDTIMELDTDSVKVYAVDGDTRTELSNAQLAAQGIAISYNDDTRVLSISGLADQTSYVVAYKAVSRALGSSTFTNTATLVGGGSHSDRVSDQHKITDDDSSFWGNRHGKLELKKIDENDITNKLNGAKFELHRLTLATDTSGWTRAQWMDLLDKMDAGDPAVMAQIKQDFKVVGDEPLTDKLETGSAGNDPGSVILEYDKYDADGKGISGEYLKEHTVYYWKETTPPDGFHATDPDRHYFVVYIDGELDDDYVKEDQRKKAAWALDDAVSYANDLTVASMSSDTVWKVNNTRNGYTSITATKVWEGDYDDTYETRPKTGILYDLYRVDKVTGQETLMEDLSPVPINNDGSGNWSSYTWYRLDSSYNYTVRERAVPGYITTYSDGGKGVEGGKITVTNTYVPKSTDIYVQKKWDPEGGAKPSQVKVSLYKILHRINEDGSITDEEPEPMGDDFTYMLTAGNDWKHAWKGLDTSDPDGNTISYTVVEDIDAINKADAMTTAGVKYAAVYSDGGQGTVDAPQDDPLTITNLANAAGSLKITKKVTVNGKAVSDTAADGVYRFRITKLVGENEEAATYMHGHDSNCNGETHDQYLVGDVVVEVKNGVASSTMVDNLEEGTYYVYEYEPSGDAKLVSDQRVEVKVLAGVTKEDEAPEAVFINNVDKDRVEVTKRWESANNGVTSWPEGMEVQVKVMKRASNNALSDVTWSSESAPEGWSDTQWLANNRQSYVWDNLPELNGGESYVVVETAIRQRVDAPTAQQLSEMHKEEGAYTAPAPDGTTYDTYTKDSVVVYYGITTATTGESPTTTTTYYKLGTAAYDNNTSDTNGVITTNGTATVTANGTTSSYKVVGERTNAKTEDGQPNTSKGVEYALTNRQVITVPFQKQWGMDGKSDWPAGKSITIQLYRDGVPYSKDGDDGIRILSKQDGTLKAYKSDGTTEAGTVSDAREVSPALGGGGYNYTFTGLESGHTYTVKETQVNGSSVNENTRITEDGSYISIQRDGATIRNIDAKETVTIAKAWADGSAPQGAIWTVTGNVTRQRRLYGSTLETAWIADESWNSDTTSGDHTFSVSNSDSDSKIAKALPKYGYDSQTGNIWEYRYSAKETGVTVNGTNVTDAFSSTASYEEKTENGKKVTDINSIIVTNSLPKTDVYFRKTWTDGTKEVAWPVTGENETPVTVNLTVTKKQTAYPATGSSTWETDTTWETNGTKTVPVSASAVQKLDNLPKYGYSGGNIVEYKYVVEETTSPTHFTATSKQDADGTAANPYTITNTPEMTSINITKKWFNTSTNAYEEWPTTGAHAVDKVTGTITRQRRAAGSSDSFQNDPTYQGTFEIPSSTAGTANGGYAQTISNLPRYGYEGGTLWEYAHYDVREDVHAPYTLTKTGDPQTTTSFELTNSRESTEMNVTVQKQWQDAGGNPVADPSGYTSTFELHEYRYAELVVDVPGKGSGDSGAVKINILDGNDNVVKTETLSSSNGWKYVHSPLLKNTSYRVEVVSDGTTFSTTSFIDNSSSGTTYVGNNHDTVSGNAGGTVSISASSNTPTLTVTVPGKTSNDHGWIAANIFSGNDYITTLNLGDTYDHNWTHSYTPLDPNLSYTIQIGSFDANVFESVVVSSGMPVSGSAGGTVELAATAGHPTFTVVADGLSSSNNGSINVTVTPTYDAGQERDPAESAHILTLTAPNWSNSFTMDGSFGTTYTVTATSCDGTYITSATVNGSNSTRGTQSQTIHIAPTLAPQNGTLTIQAAAPSSYQYDGYISVNVYDQNHSYVGNYNLTGGANGNNWTYSGIQLQSGNTYTLEVGSFQADTYSSVTVPNGTTVNGSTGGTVTLTYTQPGPPKLNIVADGLTNESGWIDVTDTKKTSLNDPQNSQVTTETVRLEASNTPNPWQYAYSMDGNLNTSYTVTVNDYDHNAFSDAIVNTNSNYTYGSMNNSTITVMPTVTNGGGGEGNGTLTFTAPSLVGSTQGGYIQVYYWYFEQGGDCRRYTEQLNSSNNWSVTINDLDDNTTYNVGVEIVQHPLSGTATVSQESVVGGGEIIVAFTPSNQGSGRIINPVLQLFKRHLARTGDDALDAQYGIVDKFVTYHNPSNDLDEDNETVTANGTFTWTGLPKFDSNGNRIRYYVKEIGHNPTNDVTVSYSDGTRTSDKSDDIMLSTSGTTTVINTVPETTARVKVRKQFVNAAGKPMDQAAVNEANPSSTFTLKRYKTTGSGGSGGSGTYTVNFYYSDGGLIQSVTNCKENDVIDMSFTDSGNGYYGLHFYNQPGIRSGAYLQGNGANDFNNDTRGTSFHIKVLPSSLKFMSNSQYTSETEIDLFNGVVKDVYIMGRGPDNGDQGKTFTSVDRENDFVDGILTFTNIGSGASGTPTTKVNTDYVGQAITFPTDLNVTWIYNSEDKSWEAEFPDVVDLSDANGTYTYYVEETTLPSGYVASYSVGDNVAELPTSGEVNNNSGWETGTGTESGWLNGSGTVTVTNTQTEATVKVRKQFTDNAGTQLEPSTINDVNTTFKLQRYKRKMMSNAGTNTVGIITADNEQYTSFKCNDNDIIEVRWTEKEQYRGHGIYLYNGTSIAENEQASRRIGISWQEPQYDFDPSEAGVAIRFRVNSNSLTQLQNNNGTEADGRTVSGGSFEGATRTLYLNHYRGTGPNDTDIGIDVKTADGLHVNFKADSDFNYNNDSNQSQTLSLSSPLASAGWTSDGNWLQKSFDTPVPLTVTEGGVDYEYIYYVEELTSGLPEGYTVSYSVNGQNVTTDYAYGWLTSSGTVTVTNKDQRRTSVTATKQWRDGETDTTKYHQRAGDTVQLTLYRVAGTPSLTTDDYSNLVKPSGNNVITVVPGENNVPANLKNPVILNVDASEQEPNGAGAGVWTYQWSGLPTTDGHNGENYYKYYVEETVTSVDGTQASYVYKYIDQTSENQDDWKASGVASVTITNRETSVKATKSWAGGDIENQKHAGESIRLELWRALKERGDHPQTGVSISEDSVTHLVFPHKHEGGDFARFERVPGLVEGQNPAVVSYDFVNRNWNKEWEHLPLVITETEGADSLQVVHTYDVTYYVREVNEKGDEASATYEPTFNLATGLDADKRASGIRSVAITNHDTRVEATKKWGVDGSANQAHQNAKVTLELWKAMKAPTGTKGTFDVVKDVTSGLAFPLEHDDGSYVAAVRVDRVTLSYDSALDNNTGGWHKTWENLPKYEEFYGQDYEIVYFVREAETSEDGKTYPASATYMETYNTPNDADSGVASVVITNHDTSVKATKSWVDQSGTNKNAAHASDDKITLELWKAHKHVGGSYGVIVAENSLLQFPKEVQAGTGNFDAPELVEERTIAYDSTHGWDYEWTQLPQYETIDGTTYELAYFVREKSVFTDSATHNPSPTYEYKDKTNAVSLANIDTKGVNDGVVNITNHETEVEVQKDWDWPSGVSVPANATATVQLYKARKSLDGTDKNYKVNTNPETGAIIFPERVTDSSGTIASYEPFSDPIVLTSSNTSGTWNNLPLYEVDPQTGKTYALEYYVQETATNQPGVTTTYAYQYYNNDTSKGIEKVTVKNTKADTWSVKVNKYWTGGNAGHEGVTMTLTRMTKSGSAEAVADGDFAPKTITLDDGNNWQYTWTGLDATLEKDGTTYRADGTTDKTLIYVVTEETSGRTDFVVQTDNGKSVWPEYRDGKNNDEKTTYWIVTNKPKYYGQLKVTKDFEGIDLAAFADDQTALENAKKTLQFDITTVDSSLSQDEKRLIRRTWHLVHQKGETGSSSLVWVDEPVQGLASEVNVNSGAHPDVPENLDAANYGEETYDAYVARYNAWETKFKEKYDYVTYADFTDGEFQIIDSDDHKTHLGPNLVMDKVYDVAEVNPQGLIANHSFVADQSRTSASSPAPKQSEGTIELSNTYTPIKGTVRVTKDVTLNGGDKYDDVAAGKTFRIGLEKWDEGHWTPLYHHVTTTQTIRLPDGTTTTITSTEEVPWTQTLTMGKGSTATAVFEGLALGTYRAYELADDAHGYSVYSQSEDANGTDLRRKIAGYQWQVTQTGTYYKLVDDDNNDGTPSVLQKVDGSGTSTNNKGEWVEVSGENDDQVRITGDGGDDTKYDASGKTSDSGVVLSVGSEDEKSPRNAEITITNNKTETGSITVEKNLFYNGAPDETKRGKTVCFGLYTGTPPTDANAVKETISEQEVNMKRFVTLGQDKEGGTTHKVKKVVGGVETEVDEPYSASWGAVSFRDLPYKNGEGKDITYYVYEMEKIVEGGVEIWRPVTDGKASLTFDNVTKEYTVVGDSEGRVLEHEDRDQTAKFVNSIKEQGKIKVTKQVFQSDGETPDAEANASSSAKGRTFRVGLFKALHDDNNTPDDESDDTVTYALVPGRILTVEIGKNSDGVLLSGEVNNGVGEVTFDKLDFAAGEDGTTYYVFEVDEKGNPVVPTQDEGSDVLGDYKVSYPRAGITQGFKLTQEKHDYTASTNGEHQGVGATVKNTRNITKADLRVLKVDRQSWVDAAAAVAADPTSDAAARPLAGATFEIRQLDETVAFDNDGVAYKPESTATQATTGAYGVASFPEVTTGWYELKEVASPTGYLLVGDSTAYLKIDNGAVVFLQKQQGVMPKIWSAVSASYAPAANSNVMSYATATPAVEADPENNVEAQEAVPATVTVGNVAGPELPSTGGPGLWPLVYAGVALFFASVVSLALERRRGGEVSA